MSTRALIYAGLIVPASIEQQIRDNAAYVYADNARLRSYYETGALCAYCDRDMALGASTPACEAIREGQEYGRALRQDRCIVCHGHGVVERVNDERRPLVLARCQHCNASGARRTASALADHVWQLGESLMRATAEGLNGFRGGRLL